MASDRQRAREGGGGGGVQGGRIRDMVSIRRAIYCVVTNQAGDPVKSPTHEAGFLFRNRTHPVQNQGQGGSRPIITTKSVWCSFPLTGIYLAIPVGKNNRTAGLAHKQLGPMGAGARHHQTRVNKGADSGYKRPDARLCGPRY